MKDPVIVIHADGNAPHEAVVGVMEAARRLGAQAIVAQPAELQARVISEYQMLKRQRRV